MSKLTSREKDIIDSFYNEKIIDEQLGEAEIQFEEKLKAAVSKMDITEEFPLPAAPDFMSIIAAADEIIEKKESRKEFLAFISISSILLSIFAAFTIIIGETFLMYLELAVFIVIPISLVPLARLSLKRGDI